MISCTASPNGKRMCASPVGTPQRTTERAPVAASPVPAATPNYALDLVNMETTLLTTYPVVESLHYNFMAQRAQLLGTLINRVGSLFFYMPMSVGEVQKHVERAVVHRHASRRSVQPPAPCSVTEHRNALETQLRQLSPSYDHYELAKAQLRHLFQLWHKELQSLRAAVQYYEKLCAQQWHNLRALGLLDGETGGNEAIV